MRKDEKYSDDEKVLILGALLHDIGKAGYLKDRTWKKHQVVSGEFVNELNLPKEIKSKVKTLVEDHHESSGSTLLKIIKESDSLSANERDDRTKEEKATGSRQFDPFRSIYDIVLRERANDYYHPLTKCSKISAPIDKAHAVYGSDFPKYVGRHLNEAYKKQYDELVEICKRMDSDNFEKYMTRLNSVLKNYTFLMPSATFVNPPDISVYDHMKNTAAIALCLKRGQPENSFLLIEGDISGIQNFIFSSFRSMEADKGSAKRLRGRSLYIYLLTDAVVRHILTSLKLPVFNVILKSGGHFQILAPNTEENSKLLQDIKTQVNAYLYNSYGCILYMAIGCKSGNKNDIKNYSEFKEKVTQKTDADKRKKFEFLFDEKQNKRPILKEGEICKICGIDKIVDREKKSCKTCSKIVELGSKFLNDGESYYVYDSPEKSGIQFIFGKNVIAYKFGEHKDTSYLEKVIVNSMDIIDNNADSFSLLGRYAPLTTDKKHPLPFEELVGKTADREDHPKLAVLKADVDNLGYIFAFGLKSETEDQKELKTISRVTTLSFMFDLFFSKCINNLAKNHNCYIIFSGGDDLIVVGRYNDITEFAEDLHDEFGKWCADNKSITISVGVAMADCGFPIKRLIKYADEALDESKSVKERDEEEAKKDKITIFGHTLKWDEYKNAIKLAEEFNEKEKTGVLATSSIYPLINIHKKTQDKDDVNKKRDIVISPDPYIKYIITRNWNKKNDYENRNVFIRKILDNFNHIDVVVSLFSLNHRYKKK